MKTKLTGALLVVLALAVAASLGARPAQNAKPAQHPAKRPLKLIGVIPVPGNPLMSSDIAWVDAGTKQFYLAERSNKGIDVIDAENDLYVGRIPGFMGINTAPIPPNIQGPNGVTVTPEKKLWAGDGGNGLLQVADVDPKSPNYLKIIKTITTQIPECGPRCNRVDELGYDPEDHVVAVVNHDGQPASAANTPAGTNTRATPFDPYVTFISAETYKVLGALPFAGAGGLEQPMWNPGMHRFFLSVGEYRDGRNGGNGELAVINPKTMKVEKTYDTGKCHPSGEVLGPAQHIFVACGGAVGSIMLNAMTGKIMANNFYFTGVDKSVTPPVTAVGVVDGTTGEWLQNVPDPGARQAVALAANNHIFTPVQVTAAMVADPATDNTTCSLFGFKGTGCIAVFAHLGDDTHVAKAAVKAPAKAK